MARVNGNGNLAALGRGQYIGGAGTPPGTVHELPGHASAEITRDTYIHSVPADARRAVEELEILDPNGLDSQRDMDGVRGQVRWMQA